MAESILASSIVLLAFLVIIALIYFVLNSGKVKKQKAYYEKIHTSLSKGQKVMFSDGIYGTLTRVGTDTCDVAVKSGAVLEVSRYAIQEIVERTTPQNR